MKAPEIGLLVCNSGGSNSGLVSGRASMEAVRELGSDIAGICSLPALVNEIPRQLLTVKSLKRRIVIDGCHNACARRVAEKLSLSYDAYMNLEDDLRIRKLGPFSTLEYCDEDVNRVKEAIMTQIRELRNGG